MAQSSGPTSQGTTAERQFTDALWRDLFGDESGVVGDLDGTAYDLAVNGSTDNVSIGSATQLSIARVAGFAHRIPAGSPEVINIPVAVGSPRTDILSLRYDPANTGALGPVRLTRITGSSSSLPVYDDAPPGIEDLPLWSITRSPGQSLALATKQRLYTRMAPSLNLAVGAPLPLSSPLGTILRQGNSLYRRELSSSNVPVWTRSIESVMQIASMANRPTTDRFVGLRVTPLNRPSLVYVWDGRIWVQEGLYSSALGSAPDNSYVTEVKGNNVVTTTTGGQYTISYPAPFSAAPDWIDLVSGDTAANHTSSSPILASTTASSFRGQAYNWNGVLPANVKIRVLWSAVGYNN